MPLPSTAPKAAAVPPRREAALFSSSSASCRGGSGETEAAGRECPAASRRSGTCTPRGRSSGGGRARSLAPAGGSGPSGRGDSAPEHFAVPLVSSDAPECPSAGAADIAERRRHPGRPRRWGQRRRQLRRDQRPSGPRSLRADLKTVAAKVCERAGVVRGRTRLDAGVSREASPSSGPSHAGLCRDTGELRLGAGLQGRELRPRGFHQPPVNVRGTSGFGPRKVAARLSPHRIPGPSTSRLQRQTCNWSEKLLPTSSSAVDLSELSVRERLRLRGVAHQRPESAQQIAGDRSRDCRRRSGDQDQPATKKTASQERCKLGEPSAEARRSSVTQESQDKYFSACDLGPPAFSDFDPQCTEPIDPLNLIKLTLSGFFSTPSGLGMP